MVQRQLPNPREIFQLMRFKTPTMNPTDRRLERALTIWDLRDIAQRRTPKAPFDYTEGAAEDELSLARARQAFQDVEFHPSILRSVPVVDTSREVLGGPSALPFGIAPTGFTRLMQTEGEVAGAGAAGAAGIPFTLSTLGTTSIEGVKAANPSGRNWFQLYVMRDREISYELTRRAAAAGFDTLFFTVDTPVAGARLRDKRNGFSIPPQLTLGTIVNAIPRPAWWINFLTTPPLEFASLSSTGGTVGELLDSAMDPTISFDDLEVIRSMWPGKIVVKGVQTLEDAKKLAGLGVDGIVLSNHGGRQLDRAPIPFHLLPSVAREVGGDLEVHVDTGIMSGADIVASIALGARFTLIGRAYLYGLMAGGRRGVDQTISILRTQIERTMKLLEVSTLDELGPQHVTQLARLQPVARPVQAAAEFAAEAKPKAVRSSRPATKAGGATKAGNGAKASGPAKTAAPAKASGAAKASGTPRTPAKRATPKAG
ncbi:alpha-hydroxy acid oxidase [Agromyces mediolanus]|uniref:alpha-hydroxy acid oxidase n=1 Tax=Agromyces mediolanus TaxID=41986 RepID=UPI0038344BE6